MSSSIDFQHRLARIGLTVCAISVLLLAFGCKAIFIGKGYPQYT